jgi:DNA invertase Pin-like site-specific DNA recombinase
MEFNSLDAQREACEAYIRSQKHEGWHCLPDAYDDGGFSGGSLDRPDLKRLMIDIKAGRLDIVVVYKVDRLTRSIADFAKLVELFDTHKVSFVSVTQAFNTTSSMGRLTLNVLLSFAQFEREVTGERIRDKIAASKKKGIRMGGPVPLGYALKDKKLIIDETEAETVRAIFEGYLEHRTLTALMRHLESAGITTKRTIRKDGSIRGGVRFGKGALAYLLRNRVYIGEIIHKAKHFPGEHQPIIDCSTFDAVQNALTRPEELRARRRFKASETFPLVNKIVDDRGNRMTPTVANKNGAHYRYYLSSALAQGRHAEAGSIIRVSAKEVEDTIAGKLLELREIEPRKPRTENDTENDRSHPASEMQHTLRAFDAIDRVVVSKTTLQLTFRPDAGQSIVTITIAWTPTPHRRRRAIIAPDSNPAHRPIRAETRARLLLGIAKARQWLDELITGRAADTEAIAEREGCSDRSIRQNVNLAFLSPTIVKSALDGTLPDGTGITAFLDAPMLWTNVDQVRSEFLGPTLQTAFQPPKKACS